MKIREFIKLDIDIDVYESATDGIGIAFCGPGELTEAGEAEFADVLDYDITIHPRANVAIIDNYQHNWRDRLARARLFFYSMAGYVSEDDFNKWFIIE